jgi:hypothetical protein
MDRRITFLLSACAALALTAVRSLAGGKPTDLIRNADGASWNRSQRGAVNRQSWVDEPESSTYS